MGDHTLDVEAIDLARLSQRLEDLVPPGARRGVLAGRTAFRDATVELLDCSALEAETLVDTLVARRFLVLQESDTPFWLICCAAPA
jgi:hypothetical protein